jgi:O-methyltransferase
LLFHGNPVNSSSENEFAYPSSFTDSVIAQARIAGHMLTSSHLNSLPGCFSGDGLSVYGRNLSFLRDNAFTNSYTRALARFEAPELKPILRSIAWKKHIFCAMARQAIRIPGDFVECGVEWGFGVDVATEFLGFSKISKEWYLYDTYEGPPVSCRDDGLEPLPAHLRINQFERVKDKFSNFSNVKVVKGSVPGIFNVTCPERISFLHIDLNNSISELSALSYLYPRINLGGIILLDDYGALRFAKQHRTELDYLARAGLYPAELPTGQGLLVKSHEVDQWPSISEHLALYQFDGWRVSSASDDLRTELDGTMLEEEELFEAFAFFRSQLSCIKSYLPQITSHELKLRGLEAASKAETVELVRASNSIKYSTQIEVSVLGVSEVRLHLQLQIDLLRELLDEIGLDAGIASILQSKKYLELQIEWLNAKLATVEDGKLRRDILDFIDRGMEAVSRLPLDNCCTADSGDDQEAKSLKGLQISAQSQIDALQSFIDSIAGLSSAGN